MKLRVWEILPPMETTFLRQIWCCEVQPQWPQPEAEIVRWSQPTSFCLELKTQFSKREPQRKLHKTRRGQCRQVFSELCRILGKRGLRRASHRSAHIVPNRVESIESLPTELKPSLLAKREILAYAGINIEHSIANHVVADSGFARPIRTECRLGSGRVGEHVGADIHAIHHGVLGRPLERSRPVGR